MSPNGPAGESLLRVEALVKRFGGFRALDAVTFHLRPGEILGLVGPNGSGKTTCINVITGLHRPDEGQVFFEGRPIGGLPSHRLVHPGINRTFQVPRPFPSLTVRENVEVAATYGRDTAGRAGSVDVQALLASVELDGVAGRRAAELTGAQQKMLDLARALATSPRLLCIDELAAGLSPTELDRVAERLRALARSGMALLVVEHLMRFIDRVTDWVVVLNAGQKIFEGPLADAVATPGSSRSSWGWHMAGKLLEARGIKASYGRVQVLWGVDVAGREGESVVVLRANGAGKTTLLKVLMGLLPVWQGTVRFRREDVTHLRTDLRVRRGMVYMSEMAGFPGLMGHVPRPGRPGVRPRGGTHPLRGHRGLAAGRRRAAPRLLWPHLAGVTSKNRRSLCLRPKPSSLSRRCPGTRPRGTTGP